MAVVTKSFALSASAQTAKAAAGTPSTRPQNQSLIGGGVDLLLA